MHVRVPGASHLAKHTRGLVARHLCQAGVAARSVSEVADALAGAFDVELRAPIRPGAAWELDVRGRA